MKNDEQLENSASEIRKRRELEIERQCTQFERSWAPGNLNQIAGLLDAVESAIRGDLVKELVAIDCELRESNLDPPKVFDYHERLPQWKSQVDEGFAIWSAQRLEFAAGADLAGSTPHEKLERIGDFRVVRHIGEGGMGIVYEAVQESLGRRVAIKVLKRSNLIDWATRFEREARAVAMLHHTNIVEVFGSGADNGIPYIAMRLVDGRGLSDLINEAREFASQDSTGHLLAGASGQRYVAKIGLQVAEALEHAHEQGVLHRDIKPANLLIDEKGNACVSDFGLARLNNEDSDATVAGSFIGTLRYVPPEAFDGHWDERADVYSLGATLYEALALQPAFRATEQRQLIDSITRGEPDAKIRSLNRQIPSDLETIVTKAMSPDPQSRYQSAGLLAGDLQHFLNGEPILARPAGFIEKAWKWSKRKPAVASLLALLLLFLSIGLPTMTVLWRRAETARGNAEVQRELASAAERRSKIAAIDAKDAEARALSQKRQAEQAKETSEIARYASSMMLAQKYMEEGNRHGLRRLLNDWVPDPEDPTAIDRRGWEWNFLNQNTNESVLSLSAAFRFAWDVAIRPDDTQIAAVFGQSVSGPQSQVVVWDASTGRVLHQMRDLECNINGLAYSPDGTMIATIGHVLYREDTRGTLTLWDASTGKKKRSVKLPGKFNQRNVNGALQFNYPPTVAFSDNGAQLLITPDPIELYDTQTLLPIWKGKSIKGREAVFGQDGQIVSHGDGVFHVYDQVTGKAVSTDKHADRFFRLRCSDDRSVFTTVTKKAIRVFADSNWSEHTDVSSVSISWGSVSPDARWLLTGSRAGALAIRPLTDVSQQAIGFLGHGTEISDAAFSHDRKWFVTSSLDGSVKKWSMESLLGSIALATQVRDVSAIAFRDNARTVVGAGQNWQDVPSACMIPVSGEPPTVQKLETTQSRTWPRTDFAFSGDGMLLAAPYKEEQVSNKVMDAHSGKIGIWSTLDWSELGQIELGMPFITSVLWIDGSRMVAVAGYTKADPSQGRRQSFQVKIFRFAASGFQADLVADVPASARVASLAFRDGTLAVSFRKKISIWSLRESGDQSSVGLKKLIEIPTQCAGISMDFSPECDRLAVADIAGDSFRVIDVPKGLAVYERPGPRNGRCIRFSPDGQRLAVVGHDARVHYCEAETGAQLLTLAGSNIPAGTANLNACVIFSPDGKRIATHNLQQQIKIWEVVDAGEADNK